jgi:hypothetical protein
MSVNPGPDGVARTLRPLDAEALQILYGAPEHRGFEWWWQDGRIAIRGEGELRGTAWHDMLIGGAGADALHGGAGDDILIGNGGADLLSGGSGFDVAVLRMQLRDAAPSLSADLAGGVRGTVGAATVESIEALVFLDGRLAFDAADPAAQAARLLTAAGLAAGPVRLGEVVAALAAGQDPAAILTALGIAAEVAAEAVATAFAPGAEAAQLLPAGGLWAADPLASLVARLYLAALHRLPEQDGLAFWMELGDPLAIARGIAASAEHRGLLAEGDPVALFYLGALARAPEEEGHAFWTALLETDVGAALLGIAASPEARAWADQAPDWAFG